LARENCTILTAASSEVDLRRQSDTESLFAKLRPQTVFLAAARVGGIVANDRSPASFLYDNLMIETNVIEASRRNGVEKLINLGSTCVYPKFAPQPITEDALLSGPLEPTNQWYAVAKIRPSSCVTPMSPAWLRFHLGHATTSMDRMTISI